MLVKMLSLWKFVIAVNRKLRERITRVHLYVEGNDLIKKKWIMHERRI